MALVILKELNNFKESRQLGSFFVGKQVEGKGRVCYNGVKRGGSMFGHLQIKSCYSFQESTILIDALVKMAKEKQMDALALCDKDNMYGAFEFYEACQKYHIKPIFGVEASILIDQEVYPFTLLAKDDDGYLSLVRIVSDINLSDEGAIEIKELLAYKHHLYIISSSDDGIVERYIAKDMEKEAERYMRRFKEAFGENYLVMMQNHGLANQEVNNKRLLAIANFVNVKVVWGNDVRYLRPQEAITVDLLQAAKESRTLSPFFESDTNQRYLKNSSEIAMLFDHEILRNTEEVLNTCKASIPTGMKNLPYYPTPHQAPHDEYLRSLCIVGLKKRFFGQSIPESYKTRLFYELKVIHDMGFDDYFLIVYDYVHYAKTHGILVGPGRGSAAGSLVAYVLGITNIDPLKYNLLFERFLNPERVSMPDIDIDFEDDRRDEVVDYVIAKYGQERVAQIVTFSTYGPRNAIKDLGKVVGLPLPRLEMLAKMVPTGPKNRKSITEMYQTSSSFKKMVDGTQALQRLIKPMSLVEYLPRNISMHAAGVVISKNPLREMVPLVRGPSSMIMTQYSKDYIESAGVLKMDFLGLKNLTMISYILEDIKKDTGETVNLSTIPLNDAKTYQLLSNGDTYGVFQLESEGMRNLLKRMRPTTFMDIVDAIALYRPGPMENIPLYLENRTHKGRMQYVDESLIPILKDTHGIIIYQEQIMQIARQVANFSLGKADILRKAVSKKNAQAMSDMRESFIQGAIINGYSEKKAIEIYELIEKFANYGFNKSHSVAYGVVAYWLAYLKANYSLYFFASILSNEGSSQTAKLHVIEECKRYGVKILGPSINHSKHRFVVENGGIRYSLTAIKNIGYALYKALDQERQEHGPFSDIYDFIARMQSSRMPANALESLIDAGAFDEFESNRAYIKGNLATIVEYAHLKATIAVDDPPILRDFKESKWDRLENEKNVLGLYLSTHPLAILKNAYRKKHLPIVNVADIDESMVNKTILVMVVLHRIKVIVDKKGNQMAFISGNDDTGELEATIFSNQYRRYSEDPSHPLEKDRTVLMNVRVQKREDNLSLVMNQIKKVK